MGLKKAVKMARIMQCVSNRPDKLEMVKLKRAALEHLRLDLRNRFEGLQLDEDAFPEGE